MRSFPLSQYFPAATLQRRLSLVIAVMACFLAPVASSFAAPEITGLSLRGIRIGGITSLVIDGNQLSADTKLLLGVPIELQTVKPGATDKRIEIDVKLSEKVSSGLYYVRAVNDGGLSNSVPVGVDWLSESTLSERVESLPAAVTGSVIGDQSARTKFSGKKGDVVVVEVEAQRLLSKLNPVTHLYDANGVQIAWAQGTRRLSGDARTATVLPADGEYTVEVHDALYQAQSPGHFRLKLGNYRYADMAFPSAIRQASDAKVRLLATNLSDNPQIDVKAPQVPQFFAAPSLETFKLTGTRPALWSSEFDEVVETPSSGGQLQQLNIPSGIHGQLLSTGEEDRYRVAVIAGQKMRFEVFAARLGSPLDAVLTVYDATGKNVLANDDDRPGLADPALDFSSANAGEIVVGIKDLLGRGGEDYAYRLTAVPQERPDFALSLADDRVNIPRGGRALIRLGVERRGYDGPIDLSFDGLTPGVVAENTQIAANGNIGLVMLTGQSETFEPKIVHLIGRAAPGPSSGELIRSAVVAANDLSERQPWLRGEIAIAISKPAPIDLAWSPATTSLPLGAKLTAIVKVIRHEGAKGGVRLSLVTSQQTPKKTIKENNQDKQVNDVERTLRLEGTPTINSEQSETAFNIIVPPDLADITYSLVLRGELLGTDGKQVLATAYTPVVSARSARPMSLALRSSDTIDARAGTGDTGKFTGSIQRQGGFNQPIRVTLEGLPAGIPAPFQDLPADKSDFELAVRLPHGVKLESLKNIQLLAISLEPSGNRDNAVRTNRVPVTLNVVPGEKPPIEPPLRVFEDEEEFATNLNQGGGQVRLENGEKYSGSASVRVTPDQRLNPALPTLGVKIRRDPGPGEYRYLRFAWKKQGGNQLCLQLNHDGAWGPASGGTAASFRYHAGPGECYGASLQVQKRVPNRMTVVTRDLYGDFGEFTLTGLALSPVDGQFALFDHIYLGRTVEDLDSVKPEK
jgi:hypothetical protein